MAGEIGSAYIRIRPNTAGFKSEAESGIKGAFAGIGKLIGATFVVGGLAKATESVAKAAADQQAQLAVVRQAVLVTNAAWVVHGKTVTQILERQARDTGFTVAELAGSFNRVQSATKNTATSFKILAAAEDIARAQNRTTAVTALALVRAYEGSSQSLRRFGIVVPPVTKAQDELTQGHLRAIAAGAKFSAAYNAIYKQQLEGAKAADKQATSENVLSVAFARFGGQAATFAKTSAGQFARLHEEINQFEVAIGQHLLPTLNDAASSLRGFFERARTSKTLATDAAALGNAIRSVFTGVKDALQTVAPLLQTVAGAAQAVAHTLGGGGILVAVAGYKALTIAVSLAASAQARYQAIVAAGATKTATAAAGTNGIGVFANRTAAAATDTAAVDANSVSLAKNVDAMLAAQAATDKLAASQAALAAKYVVTNAATFDGGRAIRNSEGQFVTTTAAVDRFTASTAKAGVSVGALARGAFASFGGWTTVAQIGLAAVAFGIYKLVTADSALESANKRLLASQQALDGELQRQADLTKQVSALRTQIPLDKEQVANAKLSVAQAALAVTQSKASKGSLEYQQNLHGLVDAVQNLHSAQRNLRTDQGALITSTGNLSASHRKSAKDINDTRKAFVEIGKAARDAAQQQEQGTFAGRAAPLRGSREVVAAAAATARKQTADTFAQAVTRDAEKEKNATIRRNEEIIAAFARTTKKLPTAQQVKFILDNKSTNTSLNGLLFQLDVTNRKAKMKATAGGVTIGQAIDTGTARGVKDKADVVTNAVTGMLTAAHVAALTLIGAKSPSKLAREEIGHAISDGITLGILDRNGAVIGAVTNQLHAAIQAGVQAVQDAIVQAKQNLTSIGSSLVQDIQTLQQQGGVTPGAVKGPQATQLARLMKAIQSGTATPEAIRAAQALQNQVSAQASVGAGGRNDLQRRVNDLAFFLNTGSISLKTFNERLTGLLKQQGVSPSAARRALGPAFAAELMAQVRGLRDQAKAIVQSPKFGGAGLLPQIIKPLTTIRQEQQTIADAAKAQRDAQIAAANRAVAEAKKHTRLLEKIHGQQLAEAFFTKTDLAALRTVGVSKKEIDKYLQAALNRHGR